MNELYIESAIYLFNSAGLYSLQKQFEKAKVDVDKAQSPSRHSLQWCSFDSLKGTPVFFPDTQDIYEADWKRFPANLMGLINSLKTQGLGY